MRDEFAERRRRERGGKVTPGKPSPREITGAISGTTLAIVTIWIIEEFILRRSMPGPVAGAVGSVGAAYLIWWHDAFSTIFHRLLNRFLPEPPEER